MPALTHEIPVPAGTEIHRHLPGAYFHDCHVRPAADNRPLPCALQLYLDTVSRTPGWVDGLMRLRNRIVSSLFGLKDLGRMRDVPTSKPLAAHRIGDRLGIFTLLHISDDEVIVGDFDRHLDVRVSVCRSTLEGQPAVAVSTVVHVHNRLGRVYMFFVVPAHRRIAPAVLARAFAPSRQPA